MITSPHNEKLKLLRKLASRRGRDRERLFAVEGEDLVGAGLEAATQPLFLLKAAGAVVPGAEQAEAVEPGLLDRVSALGSGTRVVGVWPQSWSEPLGPVCIFLDGVGDPGNVGTIIRTAHALTVGTVVIGPNTADPYSPKAVRATMGSIFARPPARGTVEQTPEPRVGMVAHGGSWPCPELEAAIDPAGPGQVTVCLGAEREGLSVATLAACQAQGTIPLVTGGAESLNVAAAAAICCERVSSPAVSSTGSKQPVAKESGDA